MRSDMGRVVIEDARSGSGNPTLKIKRVGKMRDDEDGPWFDGPSRVPSSPSKMQAIYHKLHEKGFTDVLGPLNGYLLSSVGRPWDDVFSELSKGLGAFSWPLRHILEQHVDVETDTYMVGKKVYGTGKGGGSSYCVSADTSSHRQLYVHPVTRLLCVARRVKSTWGGRGERLRRVEVPGTDRWYVYIRGLWFIGTYSSSRYYGVVQTGPYQHKYPPMEWPDFSMAYGKDAGTWFFRKIKQANKKEAAEARKLWKR